MTCLVEALLVGGSLGLAAAAADTLPADTLERPPSRVVRRLAEVVVRASPLHDPLSSQTVQLVTREALRELPVDRLAEALALKAGVVARGEDLHVRGGRRGETSWVLEGMPLGEPLRGRGLDLPLLGVESAELLSGGLDPEHGGTLAGVARVRTVAPGKRFSGEARWESDGWLDTGLAEPTSYDRLSARLGGPVAGGIGAVVAADVLSDDTWLPALRSRSRPRSWRADNRVLGSVKVAPVGPGSPWALDVLGSRRVERPFNPLWSLDGYTTRCADPLCASGPAFSPDPRPGYARFVGADHAVMTDEWSAATVLSGRRRVGAGIVRGAGSWLRSDRLTSVGGRDDEWYLAAPYRPVFGEPDSPTSDPLWVYLGYEPFFRKSRAETYGMRADYERAFASGSRHGWGAGAHYEAVALRELDTSTRGFYFDSLRAFAAYAPGGFAYGQGRWIHQGLVLNGGLRLEHFTAGPQAEDQSFGQPARGIWSLAPRLGVAYPVSTRDVLSLAYVRLHQPPAREFLYESRSRIDSRRPLGNPGLRPATVISYQMALKHLFDQGRAVQAAVFYRDLFGQIGARNFDPGIGGTRPRYENADRGHAEGLELGLFWPFGGDGHLEVQYTFLHAVGTQSEAEGYPYHLRIGERVEPLGDHPLDWDRRHSLVVSGTWRRGPGPRSRPARGPVELLLSGLRGAWSLAWTTRVGSGLPWTPSPRRQTLTDLSLVNSRRLGWEESTSLSARWTPWFGAGRISLGLEARNLLDFRGERAATMLSYPHPYINTVHDDYGAHRNETGLPGGGYWDSDDPAVGVWVRAHDPRLFHPPRLVRLSLGASF
jgi:outer membrane receptor protein involved in Fe transport